MIIFNIKIKIFYKPIKLNQTLKINLIIYLKFYVFFRLNYINVEVS